MIIRPTKPQSPLQTLPAISRLRLRSVFAVTFRRLASESHGEAGDKTERGRELINWTRNRRTGILASICSRRDEREPRGGSGSERRLKRKWKVESALVDLSCLELLSRLLIDTPLPPLLTFEHREIRSFINCHGEACGECRAFYISLKAWNCVQVPPAPATAPLKRFL